MERIEIPIPPFSLKVEDAIVTVWEILPITFPTGETVYHVVVSIKYKGIESKRFFLDIRNNRELIDKLKIELTKLKFIEMTKGGDALRKVMTS